MKLSVKNNYRLISDEGGKLKLAGESIIQPAGDGKMTMNGMQMTIDLKGTAQGELTIDKKTGWIVNGKTKTKMAGSVAVNGNSIPIEMSGTTEILSK